MNTRSANYKEFTNKSPLIQRCPEVQDGFLIGNNKEIVSILDLSQKIAITEKTLENNHITLILKLQTPKSKYTFDQVNDSISKYVKEYTLLDNSVPIEK